MKDYEQPKNAQSDSNLSPPKESSRFSRRRFLQTSATVSPILMSIKSPLAWAEPHDCSVTTLLSGNASHPHACSSAAAKSPGYWHTVLDSSSGDSKYPVLEALQALGVDGSTSFDSFFFSSLFSFQTYRGYKFKFKSSASSNPDFRQTMPDNDPKIKIPIKIKKIGGGSCPTIYVNEPNIQRFIVAGYFNSLLSPSIINYPYSSANVQSSAATAFSNTAMAIIDSIVDDGVALSAASSSGLTHLPTFRDLLNTWD